jgi:hypothetical protein
MKRRAAVALLLLLLVAALAPVQQAATFRFTEQEDLESDEALWELYGRWAAHHGVERDETGRFATFKANAHRQHSKKRMGLNVFGDRSFDEFKPCVIEDELAVEQLPVVDFDRLVRPPPPAAAAADLPLKVD